MISEKKNILNAEKLPITPGPLKDVDITRKLCFGSSLLHKNDTKNRF